MAVIQFPRASFKALTSMAAMGLRCYAKDMHVVVRPEVSSWYVNLDSAQVEMVFPGKTGVTDREGYGIRLDSLRQIKKLPGKQPINVILEPGPDQEASVFVEAVGVGAPNKLVGGSKMYGDPTLTAQPAPRDQLVCAGEMPAAMFFDTVAALREHVGGRFEHVMLALNRPTPLFLATNGGQLMTKPIPGATSVPDMKDFPIFSGGMVDAFSVIKGFPVDRVTMYARRSSGKDLTPPELDLLVIFRGANGLRVSVWEAQSRVAIPDFENVFTQASATPMWDVEMSVASVKQAIKYAKIMATPGLFIVSDSGRFCACGGTDETGHFRLPLEAVYHQFPADHQVSLTVEYLENMTEGFKDTVRMKVVHLNDSKDKDGNPFLTAILHVRYEDEDRLLMSRADSFKKWRAGHLASNLTI